MRTHKPFTRGHRGAAVVPVAVGALMLVAGCGGTQSASGGSDDKSGGSSNKTIVFSPLGLQIPAMKGLSVGVKAYGKSKGYNVIVQDPNLDPQKQVTDLTSVIETGKAAGAFVIAVQPSALKALVKTAQSKKVPMLLNGVPADYGLSGMQPGLTFDRIDYEAQGKAKGDALGQCINDKLGGKAQVLWMQSQAGTAGKKETEDAEIAALKATAPNAKVVATLISPERAKAQTDVGSALQAHPDANAVLATNDEAILGALSAFTSAGKKMVCSAEAGGNDEVLADVKAGKITASVALQFQADMAQSFDSVVSMIADPTKDGTQLTVPQKVITAGK